jgi:HEAT repeat protein
MSGKYIIWFAVLLGAVLPVCSTTFGQNGRDFSSNGWQTKAIASEVDLDRVIARLQNPATRFDAFVDLLDFAGYPKGEKGPHDPHVDALHEKAIDAMRNCPGLDGVIVTMIDRLNNPAERLDMLRDLLRFSGGYQMTLFMGDMRDRSFHELLVKINKAVNEAFDPPTVRAALMDSDWLLRLAAVEHFGKPPANAAEWEPLLPEMEKLAVQDDASIREAADRQLFQFPGTEAFLDGRLTNETSADVILDLLRDRNAGNDLNERFLALFVPLLSNADEKVRDDALIFVGFNSQRAPMLQFQFGMDVFDRVIVSTRAKSAKERAAAADALTDIRQLDVDRSREAFLRLVNDPDKDVRWRVAWGLNNQLERKDVQQAIEALLKDPSAEVRYMTILASSPQKYIPELEALAKCSDPWVTNAAAEKLIQLANEKTK